jgi:positive regulator of sigma E activity
MKKEKIWRIILFLILSGIAFIFLVSIHRINRDIDEVKEVKLDKLTELVQNIEKRLRINAENPDNLVSPAFQKMDSLYRKELENILQSPYYLTPTPDWQKYLVALGTALLIGGASFCFGTLSGFLFGIPRVINSSSAHSDLKSSKNAIIHNDNLVQISDWLTKIIVGVGLTQINKAPEKLWNLGAKIKYCFDPNGFTKTGTAQEMSINEEIATVISICVVMYFLILGFMAAYLWTRVYFSHMFEKEIELETHANINSTNQ